MESSTLSCDHHPPGAKTRDVTKEEEERGQGAGGVTVREGHKWPQGGQAAYEQGRVPVPNERVEPLLQSSRGNRY